MTYFEAIELLEKAANLEDISISTLFKSIRIVGRKAYSANVCEAYRIYTEGK